MAMNATAEPEFRGAFTTSFIFHGVILLALIFGLPHMKPKPLEMSQPIAIDIVDLGPVTTTQQQGTGQTATKTDLAPAPTPPAPPPVAKPKPAPPAPTPPKAKPAPKVDDQNALNALIKSESKKAKTKPEKAQDDTDQQFGSLLKNLSTKKPDDAAPTDAKAPAKPTPAAGAAGVTSTKLTISEEDALRRQIEQCWNVPTGARDAQNLIIELHLEINPDRTVRTAEIVDNGRMGDPFYRAAAESARRAVLNPKCSPLALPEDKADEWHSMTMRFNPQDVL
jgi:outer membrane biosynthesis protein TonB